VDKPAWRHSFSVRENPLDYDALLDKHCMFTKQKWFQKRCRRLIKLEFEVRGSAA
jgi:hypothetical protein